MDRLYSVMLSNSTDAEYVGMTARAIDGYMGTTDGYLTLVETNPNAKWHETDRMTVIYPNEEFNYNKFLNYGFGRCEVVKYDYYGIFNNDIIFEEGWLDNAFKHEWNSFSPISEGWHKHKDVARGASYGWETGRYFCGWAVVLDRDAFLTVYPFDEDFAFWCQDDDMAITLKNAGMKHALISDSKVKHLVSKSHKLLKNKEEMTTGMIHKLNKKWQ
jgi:hypothetical protein